MQIDNKKTMSQELLNKCRKLINKKFDKNKIEKIESEDNFIKALIDGENFNIFYDMLKDNISKKFFKKAIIYRYMLAFYPEAFGNIKNSMHLVFKYSIVNIFYWIFKRILFIIQRFKYPLEIEVFITFYIFGLKQYNIKNIFEVKNDSVVFDIGAFKGDTAYFFSKKCSNKARIYAFEPDENNYKVLLKIKDKYKLNNVIASNILFSNSETEINFLSMDLNRPAVKMKSKTIDKFVEENNFEKIDYIKMDVEGAERNILEGAIKTIKKFKPSLAIAIYHGGKLFMEDFYNIPIFIKNIINEDYEYYIRTFHPAGLETILFCKPKD
ncbi:FkbM family methyltransferase [Brachyspira aalborgi]|jgi:FkbM family methyltransferase|uniref:FkbM family methyltransferase n=1 Tax=Brachyspira aalborgi TaxID=29522 RepID=A0AB38PZG7_9SPIR|nr:FkbM family methyltransferase [Brachyspira aalborgi]TXJ15231.1 FkbM family methyltransferase [Brachyspira aalborgi]TXJ18132.1 FkbM family methyltransferase [Brachyspira aalborgi]TXJ24087.1 FkbM family methyltransferase [Brachyspira aalborgi]TXJ47761.1 FkbM family methyltransferase [Brachyspira aalborgi]